MTVISQTFIFYEPRPKKRATITTNAPIYGGPCLPVINLQLNLKGQKYCPLQTANELLVLVLGQDEFEMRHCFVWPTKTTEEGICSHCISKFTIIYEFRYTHLALFVLNLIYIQIYKPISFSFSIRRLVHLKLSGTQ